MEQPIKTSHSYPEWNAYIILGEAEAAAEEVTLVRMPILGLPRLDEWH